MGIVQKSKGKHVLGGVVLFDNIEVQKEIVNTELTRMKEALSGNMAFQADPETTSTAIAEQNDSYERVVEVSLVNGNGDVHTWFNGELTIAVGHVTNNNGSASIDTTTVDLVDGKTEVIITLADTWEAADTNTVTVAQQAILGYTIDAATSVETSTAT